jgi:hypothetical protein
MILMLASALAAGSGCSTMHRGSGDCQEQVIAKIEREHPQSRSAKIDSNSIQSRQTSTNRIQFTGRGLGRTQQGSYRGFTFSCVFNDLSGRVSDVRYQVQ